METLIPKTALDIYRGLPEGTRCEVIFNELIMSPAPNPRHQSLSFELSGLLFAFVRKNPIAQVFAGPVDVYLESVDSAVQPDLLVILNERKDIIQEDGIYGAPDVVIEILSKNPKHDTVRKKALYEKAGIAEYFIVDASNKNVQLFTIDNSGVYVLTYEQTGIINSNILGAEISF